MKMILKALMAAHGHSGHTLEEISGVPAPTTYRFLNGEHYDPKTETVRQWAKAYEITEAQMRGLVPLDPVTNAVLASIPPVDLVMPRLTLEEKDVLTVMSRITPEARKSWLKTGRDLADRRHPGPARIIENDRRNSPHPNGRRQTIVGNNQRKIPLEQVLNNKK